MKFSKILSSYFILTILFLTSVSAQVSIEQAFPNLTFEEPVDIQAPADGTDRLFVVEQEGRILVFQNNPDAAEYEVFLDITADVTSGGERGLLGLAFHPGFENNGYFYIDYTTGNLTTRISRFSVDPENQNLADPGSEEILLTVDQPFNNHNGGQIVFGFDGYLYVSFGDGGSGGDPQNNGQNLQTLLGSIIRIDVDGSTAATKYAVPDDNPYKGNTMGYREEIYAYGLRNVWRFSFDEPTGRLWAADVGQNAWEEINIIEPGKNYGWRIMEGFHCYNPPTDCDQSGLELPVWEYGHNSAGGYSVTGGYVYRGAVEQLKDKYIFADFVSGNIWALDYGSGNAQVSLLKSSDYAVSTFGEDRNNELYFADYNGGKIYRFAADVSSVEGSLPRKYGLKQNFPNPFNPYTRIVFSIPSTQHVKLTVYDSLGSEIEVLVDNIMDEGEHVVEFEPSGLSTGIYFYKLVTENYSETKKMLLLR